MLVERKDKIAFEAAKGKLPVREEKKSRRSRKQAKEQETLLAYAASSRATGVTGASGPDAPGGSLQPVLKKVRLEPTLLSLPPQTRSTVWVTLHGQNQQKRNQVLPVLMSLKGHLNWFLRWIEMSA